MLTISEHPVFGYDVFRSLPQAVAGACLEQPVSGSEHSRASKQRQFSPKPH